MLTVEDLKWNLAVIARASQLCVVPVQLKTWRGGEIRMSCENRWWKMCIFLLWFTLILAHSSYCIVRVVFFTRDVNWTFIPLMVCMSAVWSTMTMGAYLVLIKGRELNCVIFNEILGILENSVAPPAASAGVRKSLIEIMVSYCSAPFYGVTIFYPILYALDMEIPMLLISSLPVHSRNIGMISICLSIDSLMLGIYVTVAVYLVNMLMTFVISFKQFKNLQLSRINSEESPLPHRIVNGWRSLRIMELQLKLCNRVFSRLLYLVKMELLLATVLPGFMIIRIHAQNPALTLIYSLVFLDAVFIYFGVFQAAFGVTSGAEELRREIRLKTARLAWRERREQCGRVLRSVPKLGIKVGGFYNVEREAVLNYVDFCVKQIVSLLVTF